MKFIAGNVSINLSGLFGMPLRNNSHEDEEAAERHNQFTVITFYFFPCHLSDDSLK